MRLTDFLSIPADIDLQQKIAAVPDELTSKFYLLVGPSRSGKTSLLLQYAYNHASAVEDAHVLFFCRKKKMEHCPPCLPQGCDTYSPPYERIHMRYLNNEEELCKYCACIHMLEFHPTLMIVDDVDDFFCDSVSRGKYTQRHAKERAMAEVLSLLRSSAEYAGSRRDMQDGASCKLLVSDTSSPEGPRYKYLYQRWLPCILQINETGKELRFQLSLHSCQQSLPLLPVKVYFSLAQNILRLEDIDLGREST